MTVTGDFERVVVETVDGEEIRYAVRGVDRTWWLEGLAEPAPAPGSAVEVTGTPRGRVHADGRHDPGHGSAARRRSQTSRGGARDDEGARAARRSGAPARRPGRRRRRREQKVINGQRRAGSARCPTGATRCPGRSLRGSGSPRPGDCYDGSRPGGEPGARRGAARRLPAWRASNGSSSTCRATPGGILGYAVVPGPARRAVQHDEPERRHPRAGPQPRAAATPPRASAAARSPGAMTWSSTVRTSSSTATRSTRWATAGRVTTTPTTSPGWDGCNSAATVTSDPHGDAHARTRPPGRA